MYTCRYHMCKRKMNQNQSTNALFPQRTRIPTSGRSIGFCVIWPCISSSSVRKFHEIRNFPPHTPHPQRDAAAAAAFLKLALTALGLAMAWSNSGGKCCDASAASFFISSSSFLVANRSRSKRRPTCAAIHVAAHEASKGCINVKSSMPGHVLL